MKRVNAEETYFDSMNDIVIVLCCKEDIAEEGPEHIVLEPVWKKIRTGRQPCRISDTGGYFRAVSGTLLSHGDSGNSFEWTYISL